MLTMIPKQHELYSSELTYINKRYIRILTLTHAFSFDMEGIMKLPHSALVVICAFDKIVRKCILAETVKNYLTTARSSV